MPKNSRKAQPHITHAERVIVEEAIQQLEDVSAFGTEDALDVGLGGVDAIEQVEEAREAIAAASKVITAFRRRAVRAAK